MRLRSLLLLSLSLVGCTRPSLLVCRSVSAEGVCREPETVLDAGRPYTLFAIGVGLPHGVVQVDLFETVEGRPMRVGTARRELARDAGWLTNPLILPHAGRYRVELRDGGGALFRSLELRATPVLRPVP